MVKVNSFQRESTVQTVPNHRARSEQKDPKADPDEQKLKKDLEQRYASWKDPAIKSILQNSEVKLKIPTFVLPKIPTWTGRRIVLIGDAAHGKACFEYHVR